MPRVERVRRFGWFSRSAKCALAAAVAFVVHACGGTAANGGNSESHFLHCKSDGDCTKTGDHCVDGVCRSALVEADSGVRHQGTGGSPGTHPEGGTAAPDGGVNSSEAGSVACPADFPNFDRSCTDASDCIVARYQSDCCGSQSIVAIRSADANLFSDQAVACVLGFPFCGCPPSMNVVLDDGAKVTQLSEALPDCVQGQCRSKLNPDTFPCSFGIKCAGGRQYCRANMSSGGLVSYYECVDSADCSASCSPNSCAGDGCSCAGTPGHVTIACPALSGAASTCSERTDAATETIAAALAVANADLSCKSDDDCMIVSGSSNCTSLCAQGVVTTQGAQIIEAAVNYVNAGVCAGFVAQNCHLLVTPCPSPPSGAACTNGTCNAFPPEKWTTFAISEGRGADAAAFSTPPTCTAGHDCTLWRLMPDGTMTKNIAGVTSTVTLSPTDFATVDGILRSVEFRRIFVGVPIACDPAPSGIRISLDLENVYQAMGLDQTGCAVSGPPDNDVMRLYDVIRAY
jgi:hypothetical protein